MTDDAALIVEPGSYRVTYRGLTVRDDLTQSQVTINEQMLLAELLTKAEGKLAPAFRDNVEVARIDMWTSEGWVQV